MKDFLKSKEFIEFLVPFIWMLFFVGIGVFWYV